MRRECIIETKETPVTLIEGITYSQTPYWFPFYRYKDLKLDLLCPFRPDHAPLPLLVWICGGAYQTMERGAHIPWLTNFARKGYVVASIEYRTANCAPFPAQLEDSKQAIRYLRAHAQVYGIDKSRVIVGGESAGAHLASMTALTAGQTQYEIGDCLEESSAVSAVIDYYGPASFLPPAAAKDGSAQDGSAQEQPQKSGVNPLLGFDPAEDPTRAQQFSPLFLAGPDAPPFFIAHGTADPIVPVASSDALYERLCEHGVRAEYYRIQNAVHMGMEFYQSEMAEHIMRFLGELGL